MPLATAFSWISLRVHTDRCALGACLLLCVGLAFAPSPVSGVEPQHIAGDCTAPAAPGVDWSGCDKSGAVLQAVDFTNATLIGTNFAGASLIGSRFAGANVTNANLFQANMSLTYLANSNLAGANLTGATIFTATLDFMSLTGATLDGANFRASSGVPIGNGATAGYNNTTCPNGTVVSSPNCWPANGLPTQTPTATQTGSSTQTPTPTTHATATATPMITMTTATTPVPTVQKQPPHIVYLAMVVR